MLHVCRYKYTFVNVLNHLQRKDGADIFEGITRKFAHYFLLRKKVSITSILIT
jgi:hypothetical protein